MKIEIKKIDQNAALVLDEELLAFLGVKVGDSVALEFDEGGASLRNPDNDFEIRLERGRGFIRRYRKTFEALAK
jgi:hypothetical protein